MRTTVTLDKDVEKMLKAAMRRSQQTFKETLNSAIRTGLNQTPASKKLVPFTVKARSMGLLAGIDPLSFNKLTDDLEAEAFRDKTKTGEKQL